MLAFTLTKESASRYENSHWMTATGEFVNEVPPEGLDPSQVALLGMPAWERKWAILFGMGMDKADAIEFVLSEVLRLTKNTTNEWSTWAQKWINGVDGQRRYIPTKTWLLHDDIGTHDATIAVSCWRDQSDHSMEKHALSALSSIAWTEQNTPDFRIHRGKRNAEEEQLRRLVHFARQKEWAK